MPSGVLQTMCNFNEMKSSGCYYKGYVQLNLQRIVKVEVKISKLKTDTSEKQKHILTCYGVLVGGRKNTHALI